MTDPRRRGHRPGPAPVALRGLPAATRALVYNLGHAAFEFIEARYGKEGIRQFLYTLRKNIVGGGIDDIYQQAFRIKPEEFDQAFEKWLKERFKPFRDKQRPSDYGQDLSPDAEKTPPTPRSSPSAPARRASWWPPSPPTATTARPTSCCSPPRTAA